MTDLRSKHALPREILVMASTLSATVRIPSMGLTDP